jgi:2-desacetyl-2-hydroxyethyl bacteriochlorophyllide A dehydrogenase
VKTIILEKPGEFKVIHRDEPTELRPGLARVRVRRIGICGTDWHAYGGRQPFFSYPRVLGHELGVEVEAVNDSASTLKPGDKCSVEPYLNCGKCIACQHGKGNCCVELKVLGVHIDGGMTELLDIPINKLHPSSKLSLDQLALVETLGIGCHAVSRAEVQKGERVLVVGAGPIGLSVIPFVQAAGAEAIIADVSETRLRFCGEQMKVTHTLNATADLVEQLKGYLPTCVIDATGHPGSMERCFELMAHGGRIVFVGICPGEVKFQDPNFHRRETTLLGSRNALPDDFRKIIKLIEEGRVDTTPWITHRAAAVDLPKVLSAWQAPDANLLKAVLEF